jgi:hypothetical protein
VEEQSSSPERTSCEGKSAFGSQIAVGIGVGGEDHGEISEDSHTVKIIMVAVEGVYLTKAR